MDDSIHQVCSHCIMDTTDPSISFDHRGWCDYCRNYYENIAPHWHPDEASEKRLAEIVTKIKESQKSQEYDCLIGLSGGVDSSYVAHIAKTRLGLRPLLYHVDTGWNSDVSVSNIQKLVDGLGLDLFTEVIDWEEMKDLQLAFFRAQVANIDIPQELGLFSSLYNFAVRRKFKYVLTGANYSTECVREPHEWGAYYPTDMRFVRDVHRRYGRCPLETFPTADIFTYKLYYRFLKGVRIVRSLNYIPYLKSTAIDELTRLYGWRAYAQKHHESRFTRFVECYWLPKKFGYERRKAHLSSLVLTGQMTREEALARIATPELDDHTMREEFDFVAKKLSLTPSELQALFDGENKTYRDYKNKERLITFGATLMKALGVERRVIR
ncbi:MAG: N-acetyl sugar amidotransferase [Acidobacteriota bacterium]